MHNGELAKNVPSFTFNTKGCLTELGVMYL